MEEVAPQGQDVASPAETPTQEGESSTPEQGGTETGQQTPEQVAQKSQNRYQKLANENKQYRAELEKFRQESATLQGARAIDQLLRANPQKAAQVLAILQAKEEARQQQEDPYKDFHPSVAEKFRELDAFKEWKAKQEQSQQQGYEKFIADNTRNLETKYQGMLSEKGLLKDGKPVSPRMVEAVDRATLARLMEIAQDPRCPTEQELKSAFEYITAGFEEAKRFGLQTAVKQPGVPATGSKVGTLPTKGKETDQQRRDRILAELGG